MITKKDLQTLTLSATNKDYYQIWTELLEVAGKLSDRWDPTSTNESDPGIILLKVLTAVADKINYTIDANIREAFMPSAAQEESMRKLCEMMGYNIKYYQSAQTNVTFNFISTIGDDEEPMTLPLTGLAIPLFTTIYDADKAVSYVTTEVKYLTQDELLVEVPVIEGQLVRCESDSDNLITLNQIDDNCRYYLPEVQVAENGIFIFEVEDGICSAQANSWKKVDNLNSQVKGTRCWKFGFDSLEGQPYIQFPEDVAHLIKDGFEIYYIRTSGINGNITARKLSTFDLPTDGGWENYSSDNFTVVNQNAATTGRNLETITEAYNGFKKTVGTFDTLINCRDYMNKIYQMTDNYGKPLLSNIIVSDIRDDINGAVNICSFNDYGICYVDKSLRVGEGGQAVNAINNFELCLYPFKTYNNLDTQKDFDDSFTYTTKYNNVIENKLKESKTLSHTFISPRKIDNQIYCIKNYLQIDATIVTTTKVNIFEQTEIKENIKKALFRSFNMHELDFGEEIPYENIIACMENADPRIKNIIAGDPWLYTKFLTADNAEIEVANQNGELTDSGKSLYIELLAKNILAGRAQLFNYNTEFKADFSEINTTMIPVGANSHINKVESECTITIGDNNLLTANEVISLRAPNYITKVTYPAYVNYFLHLNNKSTTSAMAAKLQTLRQWLNSKNDNSLWLGLLDEFKVTGESSPFVNGVITFKLESTEIQSPDGKITDAALKTYENKYGRVFYKAGNDYTILTKGTAGLTTSTDCAAIDLDNDTAFAKLITYTKGAYYSGAAAYDRSTNLWRSLGYDANRPENGKEIIGHVKYQNISSNQKLTWDTYYVLNQYGTDAVLDYLIKDSEYTLQPGEYLCINYTESSTTDSGSSGAGEVKNKYWGVGTIIKPNFDLSDSVQVHNTSTNSWKKTSGYSFTELTEQPQGMYSLGADQQIEIVKEANIIITGHQKGREATESYYSPVYLFWYLLAGKDLIPEEYTGTTKTIIPGCHWKPLGETGYGYIEYTLKDGEYFFYTDKNKLDMAYYGAGSMFRIYGKYSNGITLYDDATSDKNITIDDILSNGILAIPWKQFTFTTEDLSNVDISTIGNKDFALIKEYKYVNLVEGYTLQEITLEGESTSTTTGNTSSSSTTQTIDKSWKKLAANTSVIYEDSNKKSNTVNTGSVNWEVCATLDINMGPDVAQKINSNRDTLIITTDTNVIKYGLGGDSTRTQTTFKANQYLQTTAGIIYNNDTTDSSLKLKAADIGEIGSENRQLILNNLADTWTQINLGDLVKKDTSTTPATVVERYPFRLNVGVPSGNFAAIMFYYNGTDSTVAGVAKAPRLRVVNKNSSGSYVPVTTNLKIYNNGGNTLSAFTWWDNWVEVNHAAFVNIGGASTYLAVNFSDISSTIDPQRYTAKPNTGAYASLPELNNGECYFFSANNAIVWKSHNAYYTVARSNTNSLATVTLTNAVLTPVGARNYIGDETTIKSFVLKPGINVVIIEADCTLELYAGDDITNSVIFSDLDTISTENSGIALDNFGLKGVSDAATTILNKLREFDPDNQFYYNGPIELSRAIDINTETGITLADPMAYYDYNNIANKFVISEIDSAYLDKGLQISRSSKK